MKAKDAVIVHDFVYGRDIRLALAFALTAVIGAFLFVRLPEAKPYALRRPVEFVTIDLPTRLLNREAPVQKPAKTSVPVPSADAPPDATIGPTNQFEGLRPDVTVTELPEVKDPWQVETPPKLVYTQRPTYPELARAAGISGTAHVLVVVDTLGAVSSAEIYASSGSRLLDEAALAAARLCVFTPGYQGSRPVPVRVRIPFRFLLDSEPR